MQDNIFGGGDMNVNINMGEDPTHQQPHIQPSQSNAGPAQRFIVSQNMNTLDEPVCETIVLLLSQTNMLEKRFMEDLGEIESCY